jgi:DNA-directed DNA polymerase III PolC
MGDDFIHLHTHSDAGSILDGAGKISEYVKVAAERGCPAIAFTEHGSMRGYQTQHDQCKEYNIKPIYGIEFYVSNDMRRKGLTEDERNDITKGLKRGEFKDAIKQYEDQHGIRDRWHLTCWAKNKIGLRNMMRLSSLAYTEGFYYKPRIDLKELFKHKEGLAIATGCCSSVVYDRAVAGKRKMAFEVAENLRENFGENLWIEVQPHAIEDQVTANKMALELKDRWGKHGRLLATQDAHYVHADDSAMHEVLLCIGTNDVLSNPDRFRFTGNDFYFKTRKEMQDKFINCHSYMGAKAIKEALDSTLVFNDTVEDKIVTIDQFKCLVPDIDIPEKYRGDQFGYLTALCKRGWTWREIPERAKTLAVREKIDYEVALRRYIDRLKMELAAIQKQKFVPYFLLIQNMYDWMRGQKIICGPGRGSAAGSLVCYLVGITAVDPIEHHLLFERFISPSRIDSPDIDCDVEDSRRQEILEHLRVQYGQDKVCQIATVGKLSGKAVIRDVARVLEVPYMAVSQVTKSIIERSSGDERASQTVEDSFKEFEVCRAFNKKYPDVLKYAKKLEGMAKTLGIHAAGIVTSPEPLMDIIPLEIRKHDGRDVIVSAIDMYGVAACGLLKIDVLGLRTLSVLRECLEAVETEHGKKIDLEKLDLNMPDTLQGFTDHDYCGIFQYDSPGADKVCSGVKFEQFEDIAAMTALNRPGTSRSGLASQYVARKKNPKLISKSSYHPAVSEITKDTLGIIVYQEHVMRIFTDVAGFPPATADSLRKKIAKKFGNETIGKERENFINGAMKVWGTRGMTKEIAGKIMNAVTFFGCIAGDSMVLTPIGARRIDSLVIGDAICSVRDSMIVDNRVKNISSTGIKKLYNISLDNGSSIRASATHWWLGKNGWIETNRLKEDDELYYVYGNTIQQADANRRIDSTKINRVKEDCVPWEKRRSKNSLCSGEDRTREMGVGAQIGARGEVGQEAQKGRDSAPQRWERDKQQSREPRIVDQVTTHIASQESIQGAGMCRDQLFAPSILPRNVQSMLSGVVSCQKNQDGNSSELDHDTKNVWAFTNRETPGTDQYRIAASPKIENEAPCIVLDGELPSESCVKGYVSTALLCRVVGIEECGEEVAWDLECEGEPANYLVATNSELNEFIISHNSYGFNHSHAVAYGMIAYWTMFLKRSYPIEFFWALLKNEPERQRLQQIAKDAKRHEIALLPPSVVNSGKHFTIDRANNAIRGSLVDIKGVGDAAAEAIMATQPYKDFGDFVQRVDRRKAHKGVIVALAKAGALDDLIPNARWLIDNIETLWKELGKKGWTRTTQKLLDDSAAEPQYSVEERQVVASKVNPLAFGKHPLDAYSKFMERSVKIPITPMADEDFFKNNDERGVFVAGVIVEVKYNQVGDFHTGELPSEKEREHQFWGARYANVNVEDIGGKQNRIKIDFDIFDDFRDVVDSGLGTPVVVHAYVNSKYENMRGHFIVNLEEYRKHIEAGVKLTTWENIIGGNHPAKTHPWKDGDKVLEYEKDGEKKSIKRSENMVRNATFFAECSDKFVGVVTNVKLKYDKRDKEMAFIGMMGGTGKFISVIVFGSNWFKEVKQALTPGNMVKIQLDRQRDKSRWSYFYNGGEINVLKRVSATKASTIE